MPKWVEDCVKSIRAANPDMSESAAWAICNAEWSDKEAKGAAMWAAMMPSQDMGRDELHGLLEDRSKEFGVEICEDFSLTCPNDGPQDFAKWADPVNFKYPVDTIERARNARVRFKQNALHSYKKPESRKIVHERIIKAELKFGVEPTFDPKDSLDASLSPELKRRLAKHVKQDSPVA